MDQPPDRIAPDLILCDLSMPGANPLDGIRMMGQSAPNCPILVITGTGDDAALIALFEMGVAGFVSKSESNEVFEAAMRIVAAGSRYVPPRVLDLVSRNATPADPGLSVSLGVSRLTDRQIEVLRLLALGEANKEIARRLNLTPATVKTHVAAILTGLNAANRTEAVFKARSVGLI